MSNAAAVADADFDAFVAANPVTIIDCWAPWCGPCKRLEPIIDELAVELAGKITIGKLNTDVNPKTSMRFGIMSIPTLLVFKDGRRVDQIVGLRPKDELRGIFLKYT
ncbi:MAG TPA: thioredoxin [Candidatus Thermoplasmatota archaeon]|nr:thioredoxin [Candidatus Thermoplasmatota archaeon]